MLKRHHFKKERSVLGIFIIFSSKNKAVPMTYEQVISVIIKIIYYSTKFRLIHNPANPGLQNNLMHVVLIP